MGTSLSRGMGYLLGKWRDLDGVLILLSDQPLVGKEQIENLIKAFEAGPSPLITAAYRETLGVPALFDRSLFSRLTALTGKQGARRLIREYKDEVFPVDMPEAAMDIDTEEDYAKLGRSVDL